MPYYENPGMLAIQYRVLAGFPVRVKRHLEVLLIDDGSPTSPAVDVPRPAALPELRIYRVGVDIPWHQHGARNLGAREANGPWLFMTDMDHVVPEDTWTRLLFLQLESDRMYTFNRVDAPHMRPTIDSRYGTPKPHPNTFLVSKELYWEAGGYDEDYCGTYGTDGMFRKRLAVTAMGRAQLPLNIIRYSRDVIPDASTRTLPRKEGRKKGDKKQIRLRKIAEGREDAITTLAFPWQRVL